MQGALRLQRQWESLLYIQRRTERIRALQRSSVKKNKKYNFKKICCAHVCVSVGVDVMCVNIHRDQKRRLGPLELE